MQEKQYFDYIHSFRGFAILNIVAIHAIAFAIVVPQNWAPDTTAPLYVMNEVLFHDSTIYFAMISGLLFSSVLRSRGYRRFFKSKFLYVLLPYLFCTVVFSVQRWNTLGTGMLALPPDVADYISSILPNFVSGGAQFTFWYVPVLLIIFLVTPLLSSLVQAKGNGAPLVWVVMVLPLIFSRPPFDPDVNQITAGSVIYFSGAYTIGLFIGDRLETRLDGLSKYQGSILAIAVATSVAIAILHFRGINRFGDFSLQESLYYLQKISIGVFALLWLRARPDGQPRWLTPVADAAFSIYFLHAFFIALVAHFLWEFLHDANYQPWSVYLLGPLYFVCALLLSVLTVRLLRAGVGRYSRMIIGS